MMGLAALVGGIIQPLTGFGAAVVLMVFLVALGTLYGPITDVLRVGLALLK